MATKIEEAILAPLNEVVKAQIEEAMGNAFTDLRALPDGQIKKADLLSSEEKGKLEQRTEAGILAPITDIEVFGMPLGQAAVGGGIALFATELIDAFITAPPEGVPMTRVLVKGVAGFAMVQFLSGPLGPDAAKVAAMFLGFSLLRDLLPIDQWIRNLVKGIKGGQGGGGGGGGSSTTTGGGNGAGTSQDAMALMQGHLAGAGR